MSTLTSKPLAIRQPLNWPNGWEKYLALAVLT